MTSAIRAQREAEDGFTLIELLVVVIIIGILAAIAIPAFLNQRERAWQAELTSTVRNVALDIEADATAAGGSYAGLDTNVAGHLSTLQGGTVPVTIKVVSTDFTAAAFKMCGEHASLNAVPQTHRVVYDSADGGIQAYSETADCSAAY